MPMELRLVQLCACKKKKRLYEHYFYKLLIKTRIILSETNDQGQGKPKTVNNTAESLGSVHPSDMAAMDYNSQLPQRSSSLEY